MKFGLLYELEMPKPWYNKFDYLDEQSMVLVGDPVTIIERIKKYEAIGVNQILMFMQVGWIQHRQIMDSIRLIGKHVIPYFKNSRDSRPGPERVDSALPVGVAR